MTELAFHPDRGSPMRPDTKPTSSTPEQQRIQMRLAVAGMLVPLFFAIGFATCISGAYHKPHPNNITVAIVGRPAHTAPLLATLVKAGGSDFEISRVRTVAEATHDVRQRDLVAAFVPSSNPDHPAIVIVATAGGRLVATAAEAFARAVATTEGVRLVVRDVRPLPSADYIGLGVFMYLIILTI